MARVTHTRIASRSMLGKRRRAVSGVRPFKRRRFVRGRRSTNFTSQSGIGGGIRFKSRRVRRSTWRSMLWKTTLQKEHWRSYQAVSTTPTTLASTTTMSSVALPAIRFTNPFWVAAGGAISPDGSTALPLFSGDVVVRGGTMGLRLTNQLDTTAANAVNVHGMVYLVKTSKNYTPGGFPGTVFVGFDPTLISDFDTLVGRVLYRKSFLLKDAESALIEYRLRIQKFDVGDYVNDRNSYVWFIVLGSVDTATSHGVVATRYFNLSFSADAIGTT